MTAWINSHGNKGRGRNNNQGLRELMTSGFTSVSNFHKNSQNTTAYSMNQSMFDNQQISCQCSWCKKSPLRINQLNLRHYTENRFQIYYKNLPLKGLLIPCSNKDGIVRSYQFMCEKCHEKGKFKASLFRSNKDIIRQFKKNVFDELQSQYESRKLRLESIKMVIEGLNAETKKITIQKTSKPLDEWTDENEVKEQDSKDIQELNEKVMQMTQKLEKITELPVQIQKLITCSNKFFDITQISEIPLFEEKEQQMNQTDTLKNINDGFGSQSQSYTIFEADLSSSISQIDPKEGEERKDNFMDLTILEEIRETIKNYQNSARQELNKIMADLKSIKEKNSIKEDNDFETASFGENVVLSCSGCGRDLFVKGKKLLQVAPSHFQFGVNFYIFNSECPKKKCSDVDTFQAFCLDCKMKGIYRQKFLEKFSCEENKKKILEQIQDFEMEGLAKSKLSPEDQKSNALPTPSPPVESSLQKQSSNQQCISNVNP